MLYPLSYWGEDPLAIRHDSTANMPQLNAADTTLLADTLNSRTHYTHEAHAGLEVSGIYPA